MEFNCHQCNFLLYEAEGNIEAEVICHACRRINYPTKEDAGFGLRGKKFQAKALDHNCWQCQRLLLRTIGDGKIKAKCNKCLVYTEYDTLLMRQGKQTYPEITDVRFKRYKESIAK